LYQISFARDCYDDCVADLDERDWTFIRREGKVSEELYRVRDDAGELRDLARDHAMLSTLERMRGALGRLSAGPLTPERFNP
jgi:hypothetical protein